MADSIINLFLISLTTILLSFSSTCVSAQEIDRKLMRTVHKMSNAQLKKHFGDPSILSHLYDIKSTMKPTTETQLKSSNHESVELQQISFDVEIMYNKVLDPKIGEIASYREILRCVLSKYKSLKWNRLSLYRNDCQDCEGETKLELKRRVNKAFISK